MTELKTENPPRLAYLDNLKWLLVILVVFVHAAVTYSGVGGWYYVENKSPDTLTFLTVVPFQSFTQAYFMGLLFFISGYFVPASLERKGAAGFLRDRWLKLGGPLLFFVLFISVGIDYLRAAFGLVQLPPLHEYLVSALGSLAFLGATGPLWFVETLLIFCTVHAVLYAAVRSLRKRLPLSHAARVPVPLSAGMVALGIIGLSAATFAVRIACPIGYSFLNLQPCFFAQYILLFYAGILAFRGNWLDRLTYGTGKRLLAFSVSGGLVFFGLIMVSGGALSEGTEPFLGGLTWQSAAYSFWESAFCATFSLGLLAVWKVRFNSGGAVSRFLSRSSFGVYVFHAPILIAISLVMRPLDFHPVVKFLAVGSLAAIVSILFSGFVLQKIPGVRRFFR